jgi:HAD superfamily hydrolase (TIGR01662 family)
MTPADQPIGPLSAVRAVLFDRDDTLVFDVPRYNGDPQLVTPIPGAARAVDALRRAGLRLGVVSNQSGVGRGLITAEQMHSVNRRIDELLGPFDTWRCCVHAPAHECSCRKPAPGLIHQAAADLCVQPDEVVLIGDIGTDMQAAAAAGARGILVPSQRTRIEEIRRAPLVASTLTEAAAMVLTARRSVVRQ